MLLFIGFQMQIKIMFCFLGHKVQDLRFQFNYVIIICFLIERIVIQSSIFESELNRLNIFECGIITKGSLS